MKLSNEKIEISINLTKKQNFIVILLMIISVSILSCFKIYFGKNNEYDNEKINCTNCIINIKY